MIHISDLWSWRTYVAFIFVMLLASCEPIDLEGHVYQNGRITKFLELPNVPFHQSMTIYGDYALFQTMEQGLLYSYVYDLKERTQVAKINLPFEKYSSPHANCACFGNEFYDDDSLFPALYVSQWDWRGNRGALVYNIKKDLTAELVQFISPKEISKDVIGSGDIDWVVDTDKNRLYAFAYRKSGSSTITEDNEEIITYFTLPNLKDSPEIILTQEDILDAFRCEILNYSQDKAYKDGKVYVVSGGNKEQYASMNNLWIIDLDAKSVVWKESIYEDGLMYTEPEGLSFYGDRLLLTYAYRAYTLWNYNLVR